jgi:DNA-binding MarR family transcriptional regulator
LIFTDTVSLPFQLGFARVYRIFAERGLHEQVAFIGGGKLGLPDNAVVGFALGCDMINVAREAMLAMGCIQAQKCHTDTCPTGPINIAPLAGLLEVQPSTTGRMVDRLVNTGLIDRQQNPDSRRELVVELTPRGREVVAAVTAGRRRTLADVVARMPDRDRHGLIRALTAFTRAGGEPAAPEVHGLFA